MTEINDINNWLGRSQFSADAELQATFHEFRIYRAALSPELVAISYGGGPDAVFLHWAASRRQGASRLAIHSVTPAFAIASCPSAPKQRG